MQNRTAFLAYGSNPTEVGNILEQSKELLNSSNLLKVTSWKELKITGNIIIDKILQEIENSDLFICDLSFLNPNVLFELGFAISKNKKIWILLNSSLQDVTTLFQKFGLLSTIGYCSYSNSQDIVTKIYKEEPYNYLDDTLTKNIAGNKIEKGLLYLKSNIQTDESISIDQILGKSKFSLTIDDPFESSTPQLTWYISKIKENPTILTHFISEKHQKHDIHNAKCALISGLAYGAGNDLLMLAHSPYTTPLDYKNILKTHTNSKEASKFVFEFLEQEYEKIIQNEKKQYSYKSDKMNYSLLQEIDLGEFVAENEESVLEDYFIKTSAYTEAIKSNKSIFVGRKGSGKSANLIYLSREFESEKNNIVCKIQPVSYELEGIIKVLDVANSISEQGYLIESLWEYLIYSEIAKTLYLTLKEKPNYVGFDKCENEFLEYVESNEDIILNDFSIRFDNVVRKIESYFQANQNKENSSGEKRIKISENLHKNVLSKIRGRLGKLLNDNTKVIVLIDNLDKAWNDKENIEKLSSLIFGLLNVSEKIVLDFQKNNNNKTPIEFSLLIFLRNDIFRYIIDIAKEKDKIPHTKILWNDDDLLIRVLEERIVNSIKDITPEEIWDLFFCKTVNNISTKKYILDQTLPKPRDLLYFIKSAHSFAINRGHSEIKEEDILSAEKHYSKHALDTIITEGESKITDIEKILFEFLGCNSIISEKEIVEFAKECNFDELRIEELLNLLIDLLFLGIEFLENDFVFIYDENDKLKFQTMEKKLIRRRINKNRRFKINKPFHSYLEIQEQ